MKTAEEWVKEYAMKTVRPRLKAETVKRIQADALRHAARIYWDNNSLTAQGQVQELINKLETK